MSDEQDTSIVIESVADELRRMTQLSNIPFDERRVLELLAKRLERAVKSEPAR